jgi:hypothetical protein
MACLADQALESRGIKHALCYFDLHDLTSQVELPFFK